MWNLTSFHLETMLVSVQHRFTVCAQCIITQKSFQTHPMVLLGDVAQVRAQKLFWMHPMEPLGDVGHLESHFFLFGDSVSVGAR
jgi:hypothetical protein